MRVFEQRYRTMVRACREQGAPFGVVTLLSGEEVQQSHRALESFYPVGTIAGIDTVIPMSSGLELIHCVGEQRFRITDARRLSSGLWLGDVEILPADLPIKVPPDLAHSVTALRQVLQKLPQRDFERAKATHFDDCGWVANRWCELFPLAESLQLHLLEMDSPLLRLELITDALERAGIVAPHNT